MPSQFTKPTKVSYTGENANFEFKDAQQILDILLSPIASTRRPLWPKPYCEDTPEALIRFLTERCITWDDETKEESTIPNMAHVRAVAEVWWKTRSEGKPLIIEKSRRLIVSWILRGCELWSMGLAKETRCLAGLNYPKAGEHVWRLAFIYRKMQERFPEMKLPQLEIRGGNFAAMTVDSIILSNGSICYGLNQSKDTFQGSGYSGITMEELSLFDHPSAMFGQARTITKGRADAKGGHVVAVTNANHSDDWRRLKELDFVIFNNDPSWKPEPKSEYSQDA